MARIAEISRFVLQDQLLQKYVAFLWYMQRLELML